MNYTPDYEYLENKILSYSSLKAFADSPIDFVHYCKKTRESTPAMDYGSLVDCLVFTPNEYDKRFVIQPDFSKGEGVREKARIWKEENKGKIWIKQDTLDEANELAEFIKTHEIMKPYLMEGVELQSEFQYTDKETGLKLRGFKDIRHDEFIADMKIVADASPKAFARQAIDLGYDLQAAVYLQDEKVRKFNFPKMVFIAIEKTLPYKISVNVPTDEFLEYGKQRLERLLVEYKHALKNKLFHEGYEFKTVSGEHFLELPGWLKYKMQE